MHVQPNICISTIIFKKQQQQIPCQFNPFQLNQSQHSLIYLQQPNNNNTPSKDFSYDYLQLLIFIIQKIMQANNQTHISLSTQYRYHKTNRTNDLPKFLHFKNQYENFFNQQKIDKIKQVYHHGICGKNEHKHTVILDRVGHIKINELSKVFQDDQLVHYTSQRLIRIAEHIVEEREQIIWIIDLNGKIMQLASKKILDSLQKIIVNLQTYFPELLYRLVFVNTPMLFDTIWAKITPFISKETIDKIVMIGDQVSNLYEYASQSILPQFVGGDVPDEIFIAGKLQKTNEKQEQEQSEQQQFDYSSLKQALSGLKVGGNSLQSVSQTPLNTQADDK